MEKEIKYSIITPVYNRADCIMRCMQSVENAMLNLKFGGGEIEHVIVDDGSSDATCKIVEDYAKEHAHVVFVKFPENRGTNAARNEAIRRARGEWCIILDSDDYFVDDALATICQAMEASPQYKHYMFAPDDMQAYFKENPIIKGAEQKVLLYPDFLNGYIGGDFIHVCNTEILRKHPFDERLRIYEGLFFLMFYRDAHHMLFTNKVVTIRERNRNDSVSKEFLRTSEAVICRNVLYGEMLLCNFEDDMRKLGMERTLHSRYLGLLDNYVLLGRYQEANALMVKMGAPSCRKDRMLRILSSWKCGAIYKLALRQFLFIKYKVLKTKLTVG